MHIKCNTQCTKLLLAINSIPVGYQPSHIPLWLRPALPSLQYGITPVYRTIEHWSQHKDKTYKMFVDPFYTRKGGYKVTLGVAPNGKGIHVGVSINLMKGPNDDHLQFPIRGIFTVETMNWIADSQHIQWSIVFDDAIPVEYRERVMIGDLADGAGTARFISHDDLMMSSKSKQYLDEDKMCLRINFEPLPPTEG